MKKWLFRNNLSLNIAVERISSESISPGPKHFEKRFWDLTKGPSDGQVLGYAFELWSGASNQTKKLAFLDNLPRIVLVN